MHFLNTLYTRKNNDTKNKKTYLNYKICFIFFEVMPINPNALVTTILKTFKKMTVLFRTVTVFMWRGNTRHIATDLLRHICLSPRNILWPLKYRSLWSSTIFTLSFSSRVVFPPASQTKRRAIFVSRHTKTFNYDSPRNNPNCTFVAGFRNSTFVIKVREI